MTWAFKRQMLYVGALIVVLSGLGFLLIRPILNRPPTCTDNKQNGKETGRDCGGVCKLACVEQVEEVSILWSRAFKVVPGRYNAVAYVENHNKNAAVGKVNYRFRFADSNNVYIGKRDGSTFIPASGKFPIFEPAIDMGNSVPVYTTFEFIQTPQWIQASQEKIDQLKLKVSNINLSNENSSPVLYAQIKNDSFFNIPDLSVVTILYDENHNAVSASRTSLDLLEAGESKSLNFTWPEPFSSKIVSKDIIPMYDISQIGLK